MLQSRMASAAAVTVSTQMKLLSSADPPGPEGSFWTPLTSASATSRAASNASTGKVLNTRRFILLFLFTGRFMPGSGLRLNFERPRRPG